MSIDGFLGYALSAGAFGAIGGVLAPASAVAAGGVLNVAGACAVGAPLAAIPGSIGLVAAASIYSLGLTTDNRWLQGLGAILAAADIAATVLLTAKIGAAIVGVAASPVLTCYLVGAVAALVLVALLALPVLAGAAAVMNTITPDLFKNR